MSMQRSPFTALFATSALSALLPACALEATGPGIDVSHEDFEQSEDALETTYGYDDVKSSTATQCSAQGPAVAGLKKICDSGLLSCTVTPTCVSTSHSTELFTGTTQVPPPSYITSPRSNGFGARGRKMANAGLCMLKDLAKKKAVTDKAVKGLVSAQETVGFRHFDRTAKRVDAWRQTRMCVPVFGCVDLPAQEFNASVVQFKNAGSASSGDYPTDWSYALKVEAHDLRQNVSIKLPSLQVMTPVGPVTITPEGGYKTQTNVVPTMGGSITTPVYVKDVLQPGNPGYTSNTTKAMTDLLGRHPGLYYVANPPAFKSVGWASQIGLGSRAPNKPWNGPSSWSNPRPDLGIDTPRNATEALPNANVFVAATVAYDPASLLPDVLDISGVDVVKAKISVTPRFETNAYSQFGMLFNEVHLTNLDAGTNTPRSVTNLVMPTSVGVNHVFSVTGRVELDIDICPPIPYVGCYDLISVDKKISVSDPSESATASGPSSAVSMVRNDATQFTVRTTTMSNGMAVKTIDEGAYTTLRTFSGAGTTSTAETFVNQCLAQDIADQPVPEPTYTPGNPKDAQGLYEFPCNICVQTKEIHVTNAQGQTYDRASGMMSLLPASSNPLPASKQWSCVAPHQAELGCMDVCTLDSATGTLVVKRSAVDHVSAACRYEPVK